MRIAGTGHTGERWVGRLLSPVRGRNEGPRATRPCEHERRHDQVETRREVMMPAPKAVLRCRRISKILCAPTFMTITSGTMNRSNRL